MYTGLTVCACMCIFYIIQGNVLKPSSKFYASGGNVARLNRVAKNLGLFHFGIQSQERERERKIRRGTEREKNKEGTEREKERESEKK